MSFLLLGMGPKPIGNNLKTSKKWKLQGSWNGTIVLINKKITKVEGSMYTQKTMKGENEKQLKTTPLYTIS
jgi:hypothetical protein